MVLAELALAGQTDRPQRRGHRAAPRRQDGAEQEELRLGKGGCREGLGKGGQQRYNLDWWVGMASSVVTSFVIKPILLRVLLPARTLTLPINGQSPPRMVMRPGAESAAQGDCGGPTALG